MSECGIKEDGRDCKRDKRGKRVWLRFFYCRLCGHRAKMLANVKKLPTCGRVLNTQQRAG